MELNGARKGTLAPWEFEGVEKKTEKSLVCWTVLQRRNIHQKIHVPNNCSHSLAPIESIVYSFLLACKHRLPSHFPVLPYKTISLKNYWFDVYTSSFTLLHSLARLSSLLLQNSSSRSPMTCSLKNLMVLSLRLSVLSAAFDTAGHSFSGTFLTGYPGFLLHWSSS